MACTLEKVLCDARTLLDRLKEHDTAAEGLIEQSGALNGRVQSMREVETALPDKVKLVEITWSLCIQLFSQNVAKNNNNTNLTEIT